MFTLISLILQILGTALYNEKKKETEKIIQKKDETVKEINNLIGTDIQPKMIKLKEERELYVIWKNCEVEINKMDKKLKAFEYFTKNNILKERTKEIEMKIIALNHS